MGIGDWGLGIGGLAQSPIPNPQSPINNPHNKTNIENNNKLLFKNYLINNLFLN